MKTVDRELQFRTMWWKTRPVINIRGAELSTDRSGTGPTLVWGHGLTSSRAGEDAFPLLRWTDVRDAADVLRYDARGHGLSELTPEADGYAWDALALDQLALCDALGIERAIVGGASMGAATALHAATMAPERVRALVLVIPPTGWETRAAQTDVYEQMASVVEAKGVEPLIAASADVAPPDPFVGDDGDFKRRRAETLRSADPTRLAGVFRGAARADLPTREAIAGITCPTLILAWSGDPGHPVSSAEQLNGLIAGSAMDIASTMDQLHTWTDRVVDFVTGVGPDPS